jgi:hypothetical protein
MGENSASVIQPDKSKFRHDLEITPIRRKLTSTRLEFTPTKRFSPESANR